ncbi:hypothetical protein J4234_02620 [Candidatus Woesearchaeota archaeon]|nr:hypothetical protein [Candidatus Woesearchaeota archaeon]
MEVSTTPQASDISHLATAPTHMFYRATTNDEYSQYKKNGFVPPFKNWAGHPIDGIGFRILNRLKHWVLYGDLLFGDYRVLLKTQGSLEEFREDGIEAGVYQNRVPISIDRIVEEIVITKDDKLPL